MPWLRGGTVAVTNGSTTVVGTNADFAANSRIGDAFIGPDGVNYEIGNVASATVISIIPAYKGATASGAAYAIMPVQGYPKALADSFNNINRQWGSKLEALGTTGNYEVLPVAKGGTGATDKAGARAELGLGTASTATVGTAAGNLMPIQAGAWNAPAALGIPLVSELFNLNGKSLEIGQYGLINGAYTPGAQSAYGIALALKGSANEWRHILQFTTDGDVYDLSITNPSQGGAWRVAKFYTTRNTTRAADGTLKAI